MPTMPPLRNGVERMMMIEFSKPARALFVWETESTSPSANGADGQESRGPTGRAEEVGRPLRQEQVAEADAAGGREDEPVPPGELAQADDAQARRGDRGEEEGRDAAEDRVGDGEEDARDLGEDAIEDEEGSAPVPAFDPISAGLPRTDEDREGAPGPAVGALKSEPESVSRCQKERWTRRTRVSAMTPLF